MFGRFVVAIVILAISSRESRAQVPELPEIPAGIRRFEAPQLFAQRESLARDRQLLIDAGDRHNERCSSVVEGSPLAAECTGSRDALLARLAELTSEIEAFEKEVAAFRSRAVRPSGSVLMKVAEVKGDVRIVSVTGTETRVTEGEGVNLHYGSRLLTGKGGKLKIVLPDETVFTLGENGDIEFDEFVYDLDRSTSKIAANLAKGAFRWITGKVARGKPYEGEYGKKLKLKVGCICVRGTDFEALFRPDSSGYVKLFSGAIDFVPADSGQKELQLRAGQMLIFEKGGRLRGPLWMKPSQRTRRLN